MCTKMATICYFAKTEAVQSEMLIDMLPASLDMATLKLISYMVRLILR